MPRLLLPFDLLLHCYRVRDTGLYFVDSTKLAICHKARISGKGMFRGLAQGGGTPPLGRFFGFKLHRSIHHQCQTMALKITRGNAEIANLWSASPLLYGARSQPSFPS